MGSLVMSESARAPGAARLHAVPAPPAAEPASCSCTREFLTAPDGQVVVLRMAGEIDLAAEPLLHTALGREWPYRFAYLIVDLTDVSFCGCSGFASLADAALRAEVAGTGMAVSGLSPHLTRHADLIWIDGLPVRYPSVAHAVMAYRAGRPARTQPTSNDQL